MKDSQVMDWASVVPALLGTVLGGLISLGTTYITIRHQAKMEHTKRVVERERVALAQVRASVASLMRMERMPTQSLDVREYRGLIKPEVYSAQVAQLRDADDAWHRARHEHLDHLAQAIEDFSDAKLRDMLEEIRLLLSNAPGLWRELRMTESAIRLVACSHAQKCLGCFSRGEPLPALPERLAQAIKDMGDWFVEREYFAEMEQEAREEKRLEEEEKLLRSGNPWDSLKPEVEE